MYVGCVQVYVGVDGVCRCMKVMMVCAGVCRVCAGVCRC